MAANILTGHGATVFAIPDELLDLMILFDDGRMLVSKSKLNDPFILSFHLKANRILGKNIIIEVAEIADIKKFYNDVEVSVKDADTSSDKVNEAASLFAKAVAENASDIHIRVAKDVTKIYFRVNSDLNFVKELTSTSGRELCSAIYTSMTDISESTFKENSRQGARISDPKKLPKGLFGLRIEKAPAVGGMVMVLRLLYSFQKSTDLKSLGFSNQQAGLVRLMMQQPYGINIIAGPTGSGKSTTLQRVLSDINKLTKGKAHIITVEDPPEYLIDGAVQTPVIADSEETRGEAMRAAISSMMRLDPDIIMIGEIRDIASAKLSIQAAMTGHQVWTTLHANNAMNCIDRLHDMGIVMGTLCDPTMITGLVAQRLVKKLCKFCKKSFKTSIPSIDKSLVMRVRKSCSDNIDNINTKGSGCEKCNNSGIAGRVSLPEIIIPDNKMFDFLRAGEKSKAINYWLYEQGGRNMLSSALSSIMSGTVDPEDAERVVGPLTMDMVTADGSIQMSEVEEDLVGLLSEPDALVWDEMIEHSVLKVQE